MTRKTLYVSLALACCASPVFAQGADDCSAAEDLGSGPGLFFWNNTGATDDGGVDTGSCPDGQNDIWFTWTADSSGCFTISTCGLTGTFPAGQDIDTLVHVYDDLPCPPTGVLGCDDEACSSYSKTSFAAVSGNTYLIRVSGWFGSFGEGSFEIAGCPDNDTCDTATVLSPCGGESVPFDLTFATISGDGNSTCDSTFAVRPDVWYTVTPENDGTLALDTTGSTGDRAVAVYDACGGVELDCGDEAVSFAVTGGTTYWIQISSDFKPVGQWTPVTGSLNVAPTGDPVTYCMSAGPIAITGSRDVFADDTELAVSGVANTFGLFFMGMDQASGIGPACTFAGGQQCIGGSIIRLGPPSMASGNMNTRPLQFQSAMDNANMIAPGSSWNFQYWYRWPGMMRECNFSDAVNACFFGAGL